MKLLIQKIFKRFGYQVRRYPDADQRRKIKLLELYNINVVIDIGANEGQYASELRNIGYKGKIVSFEPLSEAFKKLHDVSAVDNNWEVKNIAIGNEDGKILINVASNSASSSILSMNNSYITDAAKEVHFIGNESVNINKLDTLFNDYFNSSQENIFLKIDAQGYENKILMGAMNSIQYIQGIQIEMPLLELYKGQMMFMPLINKLYELGFELQGIEQGFHDPVTMKLYELDGIFFRKA